jgi:DnaJ-class molecular chaperone
MAQSGNAPGGEGGQRTLRPGDQAEPGTPGAGENTCPACAGNGKIDNAPCDECNGTGLVMDGIGGG